MEDPRADRIRSGYAPVARAYREHLQDELTGKPLDRALLEAFAELCRGGPIADIGCGPGHVARYLADRGADVEGIDLSPEMIAEAQAWHPAIAFRVGDMFALPHADGALAGAALFYAIVHLAPSELGGAFREVHRVLAPGGRALVAFHVGDDVVRVDELFGCATSLEFRYHRPDSVIAALADAGFVIEARLDRAPHAGAEYPSQRCYVLAAAVG